LGKGVAEPKLAALPAIDGEVDDCDREDSDPDRHKQQPLVMG
jgi:hypothetical protein